MIQRVNIQKQPLEVFYKKGVHTNFAIFTGRHLCWSLFLKKLHFWNFIKTRLQHKCSSVNLVKFLGTPILKNTCKRLLLNIQIIKISWTVYTIVGDWKWLAAWHFCEVFLSHKIDQLNFFIQLELVWFDG